MLAEKNYCCTTCQVCSKFVRASLMHHAIRPRECGDGIYTQRTRLKPERVMSANVITYCKNQLRKLLDTSSREVSFLEQATAVLPTTTDSGGIDHLTESQNKVSKDYKNVFGRQYSTGTRRYAG